MSNYKKVHELKIFTYKQIHDRNLTSDDKKLCAGNGEKDTCQGDSGGALLANNVGVSNQSFTLQI